MTCPNCGFDYKENNNIDFRFVQKTYDSYGLPFIHRVRACPHCNHLSLTVEKHTGEKGYPTIETKEIIPLKKIIKNNIELWVAKYPEEIKLIKQLERAV